MAKFTIVTICLNAGNDLIGTVQNTLEQTHKDFEIIVKDGLSNDGSIERLPQDDRIHLIRKKDSGIYDAMNQAIEAASGEYIIFMNSGDWFYRNTTLEEINSYVEASHKGLYYGQNYDRSLNCTYVYPEKLTRMACYRTMICHQATVYSTQLLKQRPYDTSYRICSDREMLLYLVCEKNIEAQYMDLMVANYQGGGFSENKAYCQLYKPDDRRMLNTYYPRSEQLCYGLLMSLTFPNLRKRLADSPRFSKYYCSVVKRIYALINLFRHR